MNGAVAKNIELVGYNNMEGHPSLKIALQVVKNRWYIYAAHFWTPGWSIVDVTDPSKPEYVRHVPGPENTETCQVQVADGIMVTSLERLIQIPGRGGHLSPALRGRDLYLGCQGSRQPEASGPFQDRGDRDP